MYDGDSFHTLSAAGQVGLAVISILLAASTAALVGYGARALPAWVRMTIAFTAFFLFVWLSPQIYYFYYLMLFDGLPLHSVVRLPPSPAILGRLLTFSGPATLSAHGVGILGWILIVTALCRKSRQ